MEKLYIIDSRGYLKSIPATYVKSPEWYKTFMIDESHLIIGYHDGMQFLDVDLELNDVESYLFNVRNADIKGLTYGVPFEPARQRGRIEYEPLKEKVVKYQGRIEVINNVSGASFLTLKDAENMEIKIYKEDGNKFYYDKTIPAYMEFTLAHVFSYVLECNRFVDGIEQKMLVFIPAESFRGISVGLKYLSQQFDSYEGDWVEWFLDKSIWR